MDQIINEDFYKNLFRLLHSPKPEAGMELKKICDDLSAMYAAKGITEYWPTLPGDAVQMAAEGISGADFAPSSTRKFEKPIAPIRKDALAVDRSSPHPAVLRATSPRCSTVSSDATSSTVAGKATDDQQLHSDIGDSGLFTVADSGDESLSSTSSSTTRGARLGSLESPKRKSSADVEERTKTDDAKAVGDRRDEYRHGQSDTVVTSSTEGEPTEKRPKIIIEPPSSTAAPTSTQKKTQVASSGSSTAGEELDALVCVVCKTFALVSAGNLMVECHECHNMYHQKCHQPNVPNSQIVDPRLLWYCHQCEKKTRNRAETIAPTSTKQAGSVVTSGRRNTSASSIREEKKQGADAQSSALKRSSTVETKEKQGTSSWASSLASKPSTADLYSKAATLLEKHKKKASPAPPQKSGNAASNTNPFALALSSAANSAGLAKLAPATTSGGLSKLAGTVHQQSTSSTSAKSTNTAATSSSSQVSTSASNKQPLASSSQMQAAAEKRLQMMKKKAAMKGSYKI